MVKDMIFGVVGGLGLFLFGMGLMSDGLKKAAGQKLKNILESMTKQPVVGFLVGAGVTAIIQSSSATTVMIIGFVNAGMLTLKQGISVIIGTNVGTTATAWLVSISGIGVLNATAYAMPAVGVGFLMSVIGKTRKIKNLGEIILGFGILFIGIGFMKDAFAPLEQSEKVQQLFVTLGDKVLLAILAGTAVTMLIQSSSAAIAIVQLLAIGGAFGENWQTALDVSIPFVLGANIGTTITAQLAALRTNLNARRTAWAHTVFNILGTAITVPFVYMNWYGSFVRAIFPGELGPATIAANIAFAHTVFNLANSAIFLPLAAVLEKLIIYFVPEKPGDVAARPVILEKHLLDTPVIALEQTRLEIVRMAKTAQKALKRAIAGLIENDSGKLDSALKTEDIIDDFQIEITTYLSALSSRQLSDEVARELPVLLHTVNDLERIGDHAVNIVEIAHRKIEQKICFSDVALGEINQMRAEADQMHDCVIMALENKDRRLATKALLNENNLNKMQIDFRRNHVQRMCENHCSPQAGLIFIDYVDNVEKIGDHLTNIAQAVIGGLQWDGIDGNSQSGQYASLTDED